ncbi:MAG: TetR family transcriptional regulator [Ramlibacter sp.]|nr:TetR family transcriptional regulator [Cryobacterium sp.]
MAQPRRTRLEPDERRAQLIAIGVAALADRPLEALSLEDVSADAGVSRGLLSYYFGSKQGFHREVVRVAGDSMLRATQPATELPPLARLGDTLTRIVKFVRDHRGTFFSLVRGSASGDRQVREIVERARGVQTERVSTLVRELGVADSALLLIALRSWVAFTEQTLVDGALDTDMTIAEIVRFLEQSLFAVVVVVDPGAEGLLTVLDV